MLRWAAAIRVPSYAWLTTAVWPEQNKQEHETFASVEPLNCYLDTMLQSMLHL